MSRSAVAARLVLTICILLSASTAADATENYTLQLIPGWNLIGNSIGNVIDVASPTLYGDPNRVASVWKWDARNSSWLFYTPAMSSTDLQSYAYSKGYGVLTQINPGEGYWVNAKTAFSPDSQTGMNWGPALITGWNLVAVGGISMSPSEFSAAQSDVDVVTLWAWDAFSSNWFFYAPSLESQSLLDGYISSKNYLSFSQQGKLLGNGTGFWVNGATTPANLLACGVVRGTVTYPDSYKGVFAIPTPTQKLPPIVIRTVGLKDYYPGGLPPNSNCKDPKLRARNLYIETLNRIQELGADQIWIYNYGAWDDFTKPTWVVSKLDYQIPESEVQFVVDEAKKRNIKVLLAWQFSAYDKKGNTLQMDADLSSAQLKQMTDSFHQLIVDQAKTANQMGIAGISADWHAFYIRNLHSDKALREQWITAMVSIVDDIRRVFPGKVFYGANTSVIDSRIASRIDAFTISLAIYTQAANGGITAEANKNLTVDFIKSIFLQNIKESKAAYDNEMSGAYVDLPISWAVMVQSKSDFFVNGWTEDGFCVSDCIQKAYVTDFSVQAVGIEAAMQAITTQTYFRNYTIDIDAGYWLTDDIVPVDYGTNFDFPNLSQSIRNKPAESIVKYWFGR